MHVRFTEKVILRCNFLNSSIGHHLRLSFYDPSEISRLDLDAFSRHAPEAQVAPNLAEGRLT